MIARHRRSAMTPKIVLAALVMLATPALAHGDDKPRHGGQVVEVGETMFELVRAPGRVSLYLREDGEDVPAAAMTGKLIVTSAERKDDIALVPGAGNEFVATGATIPAGSRVGVLLINTTTQARQTATFTIE